MSGQLKIEDYLNQIPEMQTGYDALRLLKDLASAIGMDRFLVIDMKNDGRNKIADRSIITNWDPELIRRLDEHAAIENSTVVRLLRSSGQPIRLNLETFKKLGAKTELFHLYQEYGVHEGVFFPVHIGHGLHGAVLLAGSSYTLEPETQSRLHAFCLYFFERVSKISDVACHPGWNISERQMECMRQIANGKTSQEIAALLSISEHTVNHHINNVCVKLGASSRAHAIAKLMQWDLL